MNWLKRLLQRRKSACPPNPLDWLADKAELPIASGAVWQLPAISRLTAVETEADRNLREAVERLRGAARTHSKGYSLFAAAAMAAETDRNLAESVRLMERERPCKGVWLRHSWKPRGAARRNTACLRCGWVK